MTSELIGAPLARKRGNTAADRFTILDEQSTSEPKDPLDLTNHSFVMSVNTKRDPRPTDSPVYGSELYSLTGTVVDAVNGIVEFQPNATQADQVAGTYWYDVEMTTPAGDIKTIAKNRYTYDEPITAP